MSAQKPTTASSGTGEQAGQGFNPAPPVAPFAAGKSARPASEIFFANAQHPMPEAKHVDKWFESLTQFEDMLEDMARVSLDSEFKNELDTIDDWFSVLAEPERTAALYSLMQHCSNLQVRFFITILQRMLVMDQDPDANGANASGATGPSGADAQAQDRHSIAGQAGAYAKLTMAGSNGMRASYDNGHAAFGGVRGAGGIPMLSGSPSVQRGGAWGGSNVSSDNLLLAGAKAAPGASALGEAAQARPKSSNHEADVNPDWRINRVPGGAAGSPTTDHFAHQQPGVAAVGASRRQSGNVLAQQSTPRVSVDMEPKDFRWSSLTDSLEPFGNIGPDPNASALTHILENNMHRTSGIAARRSVSSRLSIPAKSPRDTMQAQQQQQLAASLAQMSVAGSQNMPSPLASSFAQQQQQARGTYAQPYYTASRVQPAAALGPAPGMATTPVRSTFARAAAAAPLPVPPPAAPAAAEPAPVSRSQSPAVLKPQQESVDMKLVQDIPAWLRSLRLHKYTDCFVGMDWTSVVSLSDEQLQAKGVAALGARRKMLKVFEAVLLEMNAPNH
ncbi:Flap-structured DNA-binding and RNA-binding protein [Coemansia guatemalensis]|uniref:RNA-binding protein VTS1 n=3 Tax=Coemansia TaxID=4863 RepID=A0A9W8LQR4_9FUNG|nr:Flap-structured DNA-binding and RNA-binding protein [Coemansia guatemalensis]